SVEPLSATSTSPHMFARRSQSRALVTQVTIVSASFRHGISTVSSRHGADAAGGVGPVTAGDTIDDRAPVGRDALAPMVRMPQWRFERPSAPFMADGNSGLTVRCR